MDTVNQLRWIAKAIPKAKPPQPTAPAPAAPTETDTGRAVELTLKVPKADEIAVTRMGAVEKYKGTWTVPDTEENKEKFSAWLATRSPSKYNLFVGSLMNDQAIKQLYPNVKDRMKYAAQEWQKHQHQQKK
jgi:hypothetical protein